MVHHIEKLSLEFAPDFRSSSVSVLQKQYDKTWSTAFFQAWSEASTLVFYTIDPTALSPNFSTTQREGYAPGLFRRFLADFAVPALRLVTKSPDHDVEVAWGRQLDDFNRTCKLNDQMVVDQLAEQIRGIGLAFTETEEPT